MIRVNEIYESIQGEGTFTGTPSVFLRLQGCDVGCMWCDTKHTWHVGPEKRRVGLADLLDPGKDPRSWSEATEEQVKAVVESLRPNHVVLTGGEPCAQGIGRLVYLLLQCSTVQIETSGVYPVEVPSGAWVTVSPKIAQAGGLSVRHDAMQRADEIKIPVVDETDISRALQLMEYAGVSEATPVWLQPVSASDEATALCIDECLNRNWRLSIQVHKVINVR